MYIPFVFFMVLLLYCTCSLIFLIFIFIVVSRYIEIDTACTLFETKSNKFDLVGIFEQILPNC